MFEARRRAASQVLGMFHNDTLRSKAIAGKLGIDPFGPEPKQEEKKSDSGDLVKIALSSAGIVAAIAAMFFSESAEAAPTEKEDAPSKAKQWWDEFFSNNKKEDVLPTPSHVGPSPLVTQQETDAHAVKTAKAGDNIKDAIREAAARQKIDYTLMYAVAGAESSFRTEVGADTSSALGLYQFTESTWSFLVGKYRLPYTSADRLDAKKSAHVAGMYLSDISTTLKKQLGRNPSHGEIYIGYFLGPTGASRFFSAMKSNPDAIGAELFPKAAKSNPNVFYNKGNTSQPLTLRQILAKQEGKITSYAKDVDSTYQAQTQPVRMEQAPQVASEQGHAKPQSVAVQLPAAESAQPPSKMTIAVPRAVNDVVTAEEVEARTPKPAPIATQQPAPTGGGLAINGGSEQAQPMTIVRGRDKRLYAINS